MIGLALVGGLYLWDNEPNSISGTVTVAEALASDTAGYKRATEVRPFIFPDDHGPHPRYKTEWWYLTGNLTDSLNNVFGYQLTIFRIALSPFDTARTSSAWATNQLYMGHFTITDASSQQFLAFERFSRGAAGLAGAQATPFRVWLENWSISGSKTPFPMHLQARQNGASADLTLTPLKPKVLQGTRGLDPKGPGVGNASYYYSYPRLKTRGQITVDNTSYAVEGLSWMDREWSTSALAADQTGWDWFSLHLSTGEDLMYYQIRQKNGRPSPYTSGVLVDSAGASIPLSLDSVQVEVLDYWESPTTDIRYPAQWRLQVPSRQLDLTVTPVLNNQELDMSVTYWEGAVVAKGQSHKQPVTGKGYVELTGYEHAKTDSSSSGPLP